MRTYLALAALLAASALSSALPAAEADRDFSGKWTLDAAASNTRALGETETALTVSQSDVGLLCSSGTAQWSYALDGSETRKQIGRETRNSVVKWEGSALLVNTLVSGPPDYTVMDRWSLSRDRNTLTVEREVIRASGQARGMLVFRREGTLAAAAPAPPVLAEPPADMPRPALAKRTPPGEAPDVTVPTGTRVLLQLIGPISTKQAKEGDRVYLRTAAPVPVNGRVVIPRGSDVAGTITRTKPAGKVSKKGELFLRFDSLTLPNGVSRDFHARPPGEEGQVTGDGKPADMYGIAIGTGVGGSIGSMAGRLPGAVVGSGIGALAGVLLTRDRNVILPAGTNLEMVLDRDLVFHPEELQNW